MSIHVEHVMGTAVSIDVRTPGEHAAAIGAACAWLHDVDAMFSPYKEHSAISRLDRSDLTLDRAPTLVREVLARCDDLERETAGVFSVRATGHLDPSGFVKGWAAERASAILADLGATDHALNAGGDIRLRGTPSGRDTPADHRAPWTVGIVHPFARDAYCTVVEMRDGAVATSGTAERGAHVHDGRTRRAATALASVTVVGEDLETADVRATIAVALGLDAPAWLRSLDGCEAYVIDAGGHDWATAGFPFAALAPQACSA